MATKIAISPGLIFWGAAAASVENVGFAPAQQVLNSAIGFSSILSTSSLFPLFLALSFQL
jgi:predicted membrane protein